MSATSGGDAPPDHPPDAPAPAVGAAVGDQEAVVVDLSAVMAEIDEEVRRRRASGDLPARVERELDDLFLQFSPMAGRGGALVDALRMVDATAFVDPVVPISSEKAGGAVVKKSVRTLTSWYMGYVAHQVNHFAAAVSRSLHLIDEELLEIRRQLSRLEPGPTEVVEVDGVHQAQAWWVAETAGALGDTAGRVLHAACGDGWLVRRLVDDGVDAYGVDPRPGRTAAAELAGADLRQEDLVEHLGAVESASLAAVVLSGVVDGLEPGERDRLLDLVGDALAPDGTLVVHSMAPAYWAGDDVGPAVDLAPGRPLRPGTWVHLLGRRGYRAAFAAGDDGRDYLVTAHLVRPPTARR
jgi:SAM-dependent methyltransferase